MYVADQLISYYSFWHLNSPALGLLKGQHCGESLQVVSGADLCITVCQSWTFSQIYFWQIHWLLQYHWNSLISLQTAALNAGLTGLYAISHSPLSTLSKINVIDIKGGQTKWSPLPHVFFHLLTNLQFVCFYIVYFAAKNHNFLNTSSSRCCIERSWLVKSRSWSTSCVLMFSATYSLSLAPWAPLIYSAAH